MRHESRPATRYDFASLTARELMSHPVHALRQDMSVREAARVLVDKRIHGAPVVDGHGRVVGVLSATDLARYEGEREPDVVRDSDYDRLVKAGRRQAIPWRKGFHIETDGGPRVRDVMTPCVVYVDERANLRAVLRVLRRHRIHRVMVLRTPGRTLAGVVSETDILRALGGLLARGARRRRARSAPPGTASSS